MLVEIGRVNTSQPEYARERLSNVRRMAENCVAMVRNMALLLRPSMLDDLGLLPALQWQAREVTRRTGLKVKLIADVISDDLPDSHRTCVYRVVQEALTNCTKHSRAKQVDILIHQGANEISMMVQDDGAGFDPEIEKGLGVLGMEERVKALAGRFSIQSQPGKGATVSARFPLDRAFSVVAREVA